jgi:hypothetical protein
MHTVLQTQELLSSAEVTRVLEQLPGAFDRSELRLQYDTIFPRLELLELPPPEHLQDCLLDVWVEGQLPNDADARALFSHLLSLSDPAFDLAVRVAKIEYVATTDQRAERRRLTIEPPSKRDSAGPTPSEELDRWLEQIQSSSAPIRKRTWSIGLRFDRIGEMKNERRAAAEALYRAIVATRLPAASYELHLTLEPTLPHGIEALTLLPREPGYECCAAEARLGNNSVSVVLRPTAAGHRLFVVGTHALDEAALSRDLGVAFAPLGA